MMSSFHTKPVNRTTRTGAGGPLDGPAFPLVRSGQAASLYIDPSGSDFGGISRVAASFARDVKAVSGAVPAVTTDPQALHGNIVLFGTIGQNKLIDGLIDGGSLDVQAIAGKRECYIIRLLEQPLPGVERALVIAGSDKRGAAYGIYSVSQQIGVSPWVYFGDVAPAKQPELTLTGSIIDAVSKEPSVKYRGIFLNDDWPSLGSWVTGAFGDFNEHFYVHVFELLLRLKANYLWPAMWSAEFSVNGDAFPLANTALADEYGIVMGTSHHEPLFRAGSEWQKVCGRYGNSNLWNFARNRQAITDFWEDGVKRNQAFESVITIGMRGEQDSELEGTDAENIALLRDIIEVQKDLLGKHGLGEAPQMLAVYKEVERFWYGTDGTEGLRSWETLDDVTILLSDDNFANLRKIPEFHERDRAAGWGMYYHFDYHGGPVSYEWVNATPLEKVWEQMTMAYDYGIKEIWIVNVGDLKPMELPISYFLDLAYDFEAWGSGAVNRTSDYLAAWTRQQFGPDAAEETLSAIAGLLNDYTKLNGRRKPEIVTPATYSIVHEQEAEKMLELALDMERRAGRLAADIPDRLKDAYYQLVYYPAVASANVTAMHIYAGLNAFFLERGSVLANLYADLTDEAIAKDRMLQHRYNNELSDGKWKGMMSSPHVGYVNWNADGWSYPQTQKLAPASGSVLIVDAEGNQTTGHSGTVLPVFDNLKRQSCGILISNGGDRPFRYTASSSAGWIQVDKPEGEVQTGLKLLVSVDWDRLASEYGAEGTIVVSGADTRVELVVKAEVIDPSALPPLTFVETRGVVAIEAEHTFRRTGKDGVKWVTLDNYGLSKSSVKMLPTVVSFADAQDSPSLEYRLFVRGDGEYNLTLFAAPTNALSPSARLSVAFSFDGESAVTADFLPDDYIGGDYNNKPWCDAVMNNRQVSSTRHTLKAGIHTLRIAGLDAGVVLQKLFLSAGPLPHTYLGPEESWHTT